MTITRTLVRASVAASVAVTVLAHGTEAQSTSVRRKCELTALPKQLPAADAVVDSATILAVLAESSPRDAEGLLVTLLYFDGTTLPALSLLAPDSLPADSTRRLLDVLRPNLKQLVGDEGTWALRLRVRGGPNASLRLERASFCPPADRDQQERRVVATRTVVMNEQQRLSRRTPVRLDAEILISAEGEVTELRWRRRTGDPTLDAELETFWRQQRFHPATVDGIAIPSWVRTDGTRMRM